MVEDNDHRACVNAWLDRGAKGLPADGLVRALEQGFAALWRRAHQTLGDVTLVAIADRVLYVACEEHPTLSGLALEASGLRCDKLIQRAASLQRDELEAAVRFVLEEFLTVLGNLTAEILTPALHAALASVSPLHAASESRGESEATAQSPTRKRGEDTKS